MKYEVARYASGTRKFGALVLKGWCVIDSKTHKVVSRFRTKIEAKRWIKLNEKEA